MSTIMMDEDGVVRHAAAAAAAHGVEVSRALSTYVAAPTSADARRGLRIALVAQAAGHEDGAHDGGTYQDRRAAAQAAIDAWDWPADQMCMLSVGGGIRCLRSTASALGYTVYQDGTTHAAGAGAYSAEKALIVALSEGLTGEAAARRAVAIEAQRAAEANAQSSARAIAEAEQKAAGMHLAAEREASRRMPGIRREREE